MMMDAFGEELRRWREEAGFSLADLAARVHYSKGHIGNVETGRKPPSLDLVELCDAALGANGHLIGLVRAGLASTSATRATKPAQLPGSIGYFVGRTTVNAQLDSALERAATDSIPIVVIDGPPGVGKTALAIRWAHDRADRFPDGVLYADLHGCDASRPPQQPVQVLDQFLRALGVPAQAVPEDFTARSTLYRSLLAGRRLLIVLDNTRTSEQIRPLLPGSTRCFVLVTSRTRLSGLVVREGATRVTLHILPPVEAVSLLRNLLGNDRIDAEPDASALVAERCAYLPLAVRVAAERASRAGVTLAELADDLKDEGTRLDVLTVDDDESSAVRTVISWSFDALPPSSAIMFRLLTAHPGPDITASAAAALVDVSRSRAARALDHLASVNLVDEHTPDRFRVDPLLHLYATERMRKDDAPLTRINALERVLTWYLHTSAAAARAIGPHQRHLPLAPPVWLVKPQVFADHRQALSWCDAELNNVVAAMGAAADEGFDTIAWQLPLALGPYFDLRRSWQAWIDTHHVGLSAARRVDNRVAEAWLLTNLAGAYRDLERLDGARDFLEESLAIQHETGDQHGEALSLIQLGQTLAAQAQFDKALRRYLAALQILPKLSDQHGEAMALLGVAEVYCGADQYPLAREPAEAALGIYRRIHDRRGEGAALHCLAGTYHGLGYLDEAIAEFDHALAAWRDVDDRHGQAVTLYRRGRVLHDLGQAAAAGSSWREALAIFDKLNDPRASAVRALLRDLGPVLALPDDKAC